MTGAAETPSPLRRIAKNAASLLFGNAAGELLSTYALVMVAAKLGKEGFGLLSAAQAFMEPFDVLAGFGLGAIVVKVAAERKGVDDQLRGTALALRYLAAPIAVVVALCVCAWRRPELLPVVAVASLGTLLAPLTVNASLPFDFHQTQHRRISLPFLASIVRLSTVVLAVRVLPTPVGFQLSSFGATLCTCALSLWLARRFYPGNLSFDRPLFFRILRLGLPAAALEFISMLYLRGSYLVLRDQGAATLGEYAAADRLVKPVMVIGGIFLASALPTIAVMAHEGKFSELTSAYRKTLVRLLGLFAPVVAVAWLVAPLLLEKLAPGWVGAVWPFRILSLATVFMLVNSLTSVFITALGQLRLVTGVALINLVVFFALAHVLVPRYGATGAALATTLMEGINTALQVSIVVALLRRGAVG